MKRPISITVVAVLMTALGLVLLWPLADLFLNPKPQLGRSLAAIAAALLALVSAYGLFTMRPWSLWTTLTFLLLVISVTAIINAFYIAVIFGLLALYVGFRLPRHFDTKSEAQTTPPSSLS